MPPMRLEPTTSQSQVKHSTAELLWVPIYLVNQQLAILIKCQALFNLFINNVACSRLCVVKSLYHSKILLKSVVFAQMYQFRLNLS